MDLSIVLNNPQEYYSFHSWLWFRDSASFSTKNPKCCFPLPSLTNTFFLEYRVKVFNGADCDESRIYDEVSRIKCGANECTNAGPGNSGSVECGTSTAYYTSTPGCSVSMATFYLDDLDKCKNFKFLGSSEQKSGYITARAAGTTVVAPIVLIATVVFMAIGLF